MSEGLLIDIMELTIQTTALICAPMVSTILVASIVLQIVQSVTQMKDQAIAFIPKMFLGGAVFVVCIPWYIQLLRQYCDIIFSLITKASQ